MKKSEDFPLDYFQWLKDNLPKGWTAEARHIKYLATQLNELTSRVIDRLGIFMPPRHAKTQTVTVRYAVYRLLLAEARGEVIHILVTGYSDRFARRLSRMIRNAAVEAGLGLSKDKNATDEWETAGGCLVMARGVGAPPTGVGFHLIIIDDPIKRREDADSLAFREKMKDWYTDDLIQRLEPGGAVLLIQTRWHEDDLGEFAPSQEPGVWRLVKLAAIAEEGDQLGRSVGESLWPQRYNESDLARIRSIVRREEGERAWESLYQQNPTPRDGAFFKVTQIEFVNEVPEGLPSCRAWDLAASDGAGDRTAGVRIDGPDKDGYYYFVHVKKGQWEPHTRNRIIRETAEEDGIFVKVWGPQDPGAAGVESAIAFKKNLAGFAVTTGPVSGSKELRADPMASQVNAGNFRIVRGEWNAEFIEELRQFPRGKHDDQVDAGASSFNKLRVKREFKVFIGRTGTTGRDDESASEDEE